MTRFMIIPIFIICMISISSCSKHPVDEAKQIMEEQIPLLLDRNAEEKIFAWCKENKERVDRINKWLNSPEGQTEESLKLFNEIERSGLYVKYRNALRVPTPSSIEAKRKLRECVIR
jgi:hypothetical protein